MNKKLAFDNRLCYERSVARQHAIHQQKMETMVPTALSPSKVYLDSNEPSKQPHLGTKAKRKQLDKERQNDISVQNQRLASKMDHILHRQENVLLAAASAYGVKSPRAAAGAILSTSGASSPPRTPVPPPRTPMLLSPKKPTASSSSSSSTFAHGHGPARVHMPGIRLDATQTPLVDCYLSPEVAIGRGAACNKRTLINRGVQKRQQERIAEENRRMKQRVNAQKPFYDTRKWDADWQKTGQKFAHIRQNGTIGYLLPPPKTANTGIGSPPSRGGGPMNASPRALKTQRNAKTSDGLPLIQQRGQHPNARDMPSRSNRDRQQQPSVGKRGPGAGGKSQPQRMRIDCDESDCDDGLRVVELPPCVLLEATTRKGIQIQVEELQIELLKADKLSSDCEAGDRGLVIRGKWMEDIEGEHFVSVETLERIAQEIDDLEIMIKLETVHRIPRVGNFPRLSELLTEEELEKLLFRLVQRLTIDVFEDRKELVISTRPSRAGGQAAGALLQPGDEATGEPESRQRRRPRTCPSTMPSNSASSLNDLDFRRPSGADSAAAGTEQEQGEMRRQLGAWLNVGTKRFGIRHQDALYVVRVSFASDSSTFSMVSVVVSGPPQACATREEEIAFSDSEVRTLVQRLESQQLTRDEFVRQEIVKMLD